jgi:hypothetical protein
MLSLIPLGCCNASGWSRKYKEKPVLDFKGDFKKWFKTKEKTLAYIGKLTGRK